MDDLEFNKANTRAYLQGLVTVAGLDGPQQIDLIVCGGSALMIGGNFRESTHDIDGFIRVDDPTSPMKNKALRYQARYLEDVAGRARASASNGGNKWIDPSVYKVFDGSTVDLTTREHMVHVDHYASGETTMDIYVPDATLMLAMKVNSMRINESNPTGKAKDLDDILNLLSLHPDIKNDEELMATSAKFFPDIKGKPHVVDGAREIFSRHKDRPRHPNPTYAGKSGHHPQ